MPITVTTTVYRYDELSPKAQQRVLRDFIHVNVDNSYWYQDVLDEWTTKLEEMGFEEVKISFSGFGSQGDGASFTARGVNIREFLKAEKIGKEYRSLIGIMNYDWSVWGCVRRGRSRYVHHNTIYGIVETDYNGESVEVDNRVWMQTKDLTIHLTTRARELSRQIYRDLDDRYFKLISDEAIAQELMESEHYFHEDGTYACEINYVTL